MLKLNLERFFKIKGITKPNQYLMKAGNSVGYASQLVHGRSISIQFDKLELLCRIFNCTPNDLFEFIDDKGNPLAEGHALHALSKKDAIEGINRILHDLPFEKIEELYRVLKGGPNPNPQP